MDFISIFEEKLCEYTGFKYAIAVDCCTNALVLCFDMKNRLKEIDKNKFILEIPKHTYLSVPMTLLNYGWKINFVDNKWNGKYSFGVNIYDAATDFHKNMAEEYRNNDLVCVSF